MRKVTVGIMLFSLLLIIGMIAANTNGLFITAPASYYVVNLPTEFARSRTPINITSSSYNVSQAPIQGGIHLTMGTDGSVGEVSSGFYIVYGNLGDIGGRNNITITIHNYVQTGSANLAMNLWFDKSNNSEFFQWNGAGVFTGVDGDYYVLGECGGGYSCPLNPSGTSMYLNDSTTFSQGSGGGGPVIPLSNFKKLPRAVNGIYNGTYTAIWIGLDSSAAGKASADIILNGPLFTATLTSTSTSVVTASSTSTSTTTTTSTSTSVSTSVSTSAATTTTNIATSTTTTYTPTTSTISYTSSIATTTTTSTTISSFSTSTITSSTTTTSTTSSVLSTRTESTTTTTTSVSTVPSTTTTGTSTTTVVSSTTSTTTITGLGDLLGQPVLLGIVALLSLSTLGVGAVAGFLKWGLGRPKTPRSSTASGLSQTPIAKPPLPTRAELETLRKNKRITQATYDNYLRQLSAQGK